MSRLYCSLMGTTRRGWAVRARGTLPAPIRQGYSIACFSRPLPLARDSLRLTCLMGERPGPAEVALSSRGCSYCLTTPLSAWCDRWFGFSDAEVEALLNHAGREEYLDDAREWLEGYRFVGLIARIQRV